MVLVLRSNSMEIIGNQVGITTIFQDESNKNVPICTLSQRILPICTTSWVAI